ncbi:MAG: GYD domain-containing protein [Actinomycetota bacterium]|jgi:uncharacterized protein with GYD domain|nr:GYD domain-containing protein [Actinomycetota bacterium]
MPTYIALVDWTDQGIRPVGAAVERADKGAEIARKHGARFLEHYWTIGPYDAVAIVAAPDEESATTVFREPGTAGNGRPTLLRAFDCEEMSRIIDRLGPSLGA